MPLLKNPRHEKFAQGIAAGKSQTEAYVEAGYKNDRRHASRLLATNGGIVQRIKELMSAAALRAEVTQDSLVAECDEAIEFARAAKDGHMMVAATRLKAQLTGNIVKERENAKQPLGDVPDDVVKDELLRLRADREKAANTAVH